MPKPRVYWLHALTPTHAGVGRGVGYIDLPIDRDEVTGWPLIRGSSFKGVWADYHRATEDNRKSDQLLKIAFGYQPKDGTEGNSGSLIPTDARIVCLPVRSFRGTFAWCTSALALRLLRRTLRSAGLRNRRLFPIRRPRRTRTPKSRGRCSMPRKRCWLTRTGQYTSKTSTFQGAQNDATTAWAEAIAAWVFPGDKAWQDVFKKRFAVLPDVVFDFLTETGTEVHTRVKIDDETKTVADKALWTEESLPAETILAGVVACDRVFGKNGAEIKEADLLEQFTRHKDTGKRKWSSRLAARRRSAAARSGACSRKGVRNERSHPKPDGWPRRRSLLQRPMARPNKEYVSFAKKFPALIHTCGLAQAVAFALAKGGQQGVYAEDLAAVLQTVGTREYVVR